jgi:predicted GH43/DUF377 family glycosyl hydrolase
MVFTRSASNPILSRDDIPDVPPDVVDATSVFNPGAALVDGRHLLLLRVQTRGRRTYLMVAESPGDGVFDVRPELVELVGFEMMGEVVHHIYDPRITRIDGTWYVVLAVDVDSTCRLAIARTDGFRRLELVGAVGEGRADGASTASGGTAGAWNDVRNGVLFPERIGGRYAMLLRPNRVSAGEGLTSGDTITLATSEDLVSWRDEGDVMSGRWHYWDELIGPGPPPVKTREGWLLVYHGIATHLVSSWIYQTGVVLLDLEDPTRVIARGRDNVLEPREKWEMTGQVPNVVFPSGLTVDIGADGFADPDSELRLYYGAADTCVGLATATVGRLLEACRR